MLPRFAAVCLALTLLGCSPDEGPPGPPPDPFDPLPASCSTNPHQDRCRRDGGRVAPEGENLDGPIA